MEVQSPSKPLIFNKTFLVKSKLNSGSFGEVFLGKNIHTNEKVAIKLEVIKEDQADINRSLLREASILNHMGAVPGVAKLIWFGTEQSYDVMVLEVLGKDLATILKSYKKLSLGTILLLASKILNILQSIHEKDVIHRDIKPENILIGIEERSEDFFLIDYGISKCYRDPKGRHLIFRENKPFIGTMRYASIHSHMGVELSRRDDLESLGYVLLYLIKGYLPWQNVEAKTKEKTFQVGKIKQKLKITELCKDLPKEFVMYFEYVKDLEFNESPDYEYLKGLFTECAKNNQLSLRNIVLDWRMNKDKMAEYLLGTNGKSPTNHNKSKSPNNRTPIKIHKNDRTFEDLKSPEKHKDQTMQSFTIFTMKSIHAIGDPMKNGSTMNSLNNFYVPSKTYLKEDKFEDSKRDKIVRREKKNDGTLISQLSQNNSVNSKISKGNSSLYNFYTPTRNYCKEDKYEDCKNFHLFE